MPIPEKEYQDEYKQLWARKTELEHLTDALKGIERNTRFIVSLLALLAFLLVIYGYALVQRADKIIELFN